VAPDDAPGIDDVRRGPPAWPASRTARRSCARARSTPSRAARALWRPLLAGTIPAAGLRVGVVPSGANVDAARFAQLVS